MRIIILTAIKEWIMRKIENGDKVWRKAAEEIGAGVDQFRSQDNLITDDRLYRFFLAVCRETGMEMKDLEQNFIGYWMIDFAPRLYQTYTRKVENTKDFMITIIKINNELYGLFPDNPYIGRVDLTDTGQNSLIAAYSNEKSLIDLIAIIRAVSNVYNDTFSLKKLNLTSSEIVFQKH